MRSRRYNEVCHPGVGPGVEARRVYVEGLGLADRLAHAAGARFVVWDVGLGGAANVTAVFRCAARFNVRLLALSFDRDNAQLAFSLRHAEALGYFGEYAAAAEALLKTDQVTFESGAARVTWRRVHGDFPALLESGGPAEWPAPHAILFDPHSPRVNPEMWSPALFEAIAARLDRSQPCGLATYSRSTAVRAALLLAGFFVGTGPGTGRKEETTIAANDARLIRHPLDARWLERARRSPLTARLWDRLAALPQFTKGAPP